MFRSRMIKDGEERPNDRHEAGETILTACAAKHGHPIPNGGDQDDGFRCWCPSLNEYTSCEGDSGYD